MREELRNFLKLYSVKGIGYKFLTEFYQKYKTFGENFEENLKEFLDRKGWDKERKESLLKLLREEKHTKLLFRFLEKANVKVIPFFDRDFPKELNNYAKVETLFVLGNFDYSKGFSIVGTRKAGVEGKLKAYEFGKELAKNGFVVISGGAEGIDSQAHRGALSAGKTALVLGEGLYHFLRRKRDFAKKVLEKGGFIVSQFRPFESGGKWTFPLRNALIAYFGIYGTLVVEAPKKSGALITADYALKMGRPLYVYLNCLQNPNYEGSLELFEICKAKLVLNPSRLLEYIGAQSVENFKNEITEGGLEKILSEKPRTFDELLSLTGLREEELLTELTNLELDGKVKSEGGYYIWIG